MHERRQHQRIAPKGSLHIGAFSGRVVNISKSGILVAMHGEPPQLSVEQQVTLDIRLDTAAAQWLTATGRVARIDADGIAITFKEPHPTLTSMIDKATGASNANTRELTVVLIDRDGDRRHRMSHDLRARGCTVTEVGSPLEAIVRLGELGFEPNVIAIADSFPAEDARAMRDFIQRRHASAQLVTIVDDSLPV
jgi:hypothetical protein